MNSNELYYNLLKEAQKEKMKISKTTLLKTKQLYESSINDLIKQLSNVSSYNKSWLNGQIDYLKKKIKDIDMTVEKMIRDGVTETSQLMTNVNGDFFSYINKKHGLDIDPNILESLYATNESVIAKIIEGRLYKDNKSLSTRLWNCSNKNLENIQDILLKGMVEKKSIKDICSELYAYTGKGNVKVPEIRRQYGDLSSNALRLVRTSLNHAFTETMKDECRYNPFVEGYKWTLSSSHFERQIKRFGEDICDTYSKHDEGIGIGVFKKTNVPIAHPNCLCIVTAHIPKSFEEIGDEINDWIHGANNSGIEKWVNSRK